jgi:hypothetical protein
MSRQQKTYEGELMEKGKSNEEIIFNWLGNFCKETMDFREYKLAQRLDVDCGIVSHDGEIVLAEIKSCNYISRDGNLCFEVNRINHHVKDKWFYLGWGWRSPAKHLIVRNPKTGDTFIFEFSKLRQAVASYVLKNGKKLMDEIKSAKGRDFIQIVETDNQKTTFNYLIPMSYLEEKYKYYQIQEANK